MFCLKHTHVSVSKPDPVLVVSTTAISPRLSLWPSAACRSGTGRVLYTTGRKPSEAACVGWCWVTWQSRRWTSGEDAQCSGCGGENRYSQHPSKHAHKLVTHQVTGGLPADEYEILKNFGTESFQILENNYNRRLLLTIPARRAALFSRCAAAGFL